MNRSIYIKYPGETGSALVATMGVVLLIALVAAGMVTMGRQQIFSAQRMRDHVKAQLIAEAGANDAYNVLKTNFAARLNPAYFPLTSFPSSDPGTYDATVTTSLSDSNRASIVSVGVYGSATATVKLDVKNKPLVTTNGVLPTTSPWAYGVFCNGYVGFNGSSTLKGAVHVNNYLSCNGSIAWGSSANPVYVECSGAQGFSVNGASVITGTIKAPVINVNGTVTTRVVGPVPTIQLPALNLTSYYQTALANGQVVGSSITINNKQTWPNVASIPGGILWVNGTLTVKGGGNLNYNGCIIATGGITLNGSTSQTQVGNLPAFISRDGSIEMNGSQDLNGLIYAGGDIRMNGSGTLDGAIMSGGNILFNGSANITVNYVNANPDGTTQTTQDHVIITAWQD